MKFHNRLQKMNFLSEYCAKTLTYTDNLHFVKHTHMIDGKSVGKHSARKLFHRFSVPHIGMAVIACAVAESAGLADGLFEQDYFQPAGVVRASIERRGGAVVSAAIGGPVTLDEPVCITL